jgi:hypothetical protein
MLLGPRRCITHELFIHFCVPPLMGDSNVYSGCKSLFFYNLSPYLNYRFVEYINWRIKAYSSYNSVQLLHE